jgi:predicted nuclease of predicted toxin-antitoxin system
MNLSPVWVSFLNQAGVDAIHWSAVGRANAPDAELMDWARTNDCVVFTNDLDFSALLAMTRGTGPSVLQLRLQDLLPDAVGDVVLRVLQQQQQSLAKGAVVTVGESGTRVRVLPLHGEPA